MPQLLSAIGGGDILKSLQPNAIPQYYGLPFTGSNIAYLSMPHKTTIFTPEDILKQRVLGKENYKHYIRAHGGFLGWLNRFTFRKNKKYINEVRENFNGILTPQILPKSISWSKAPEVMYTGSKYPVIKTALRPDHFAYSLSMGNVYAKHPYYHNLVSRVAEKTIPKLQWIVPSLILGGDYLADKMEDGIAKDVTQAATDYAPELYAGTLALGMAPKIKALSDAYKITPKSFVERASLKAGLKESLLGILGSYGVLKGIQLIRDKVSDDDEIEKKSSVLKAAPELIKSLMLSQAAPEYVSSALVGAMLYAVAKNMERDKLVEGREHLPIMTATTALAADPSASALGSLYSIINKGTLAPFGGTFNGN